MNTRAKNSWLLNLGLASAGTITLLLLHLLGAQAPVHATGGSWDTDGILVNTTESEIERLVIVDTRSQSIMVYKTEGLGKFRLTAARSYKYDLELQDTSKNDEIEQHSGATVLRIYDMYEESKR